MQNNFEITVEIIDGALYINSQLISSIRIRNGIYKIANGSTGTGHSAHPNIHSSGSVAAMKKLGFWRKDARTIKAHGQIYNIDSIVIDDAIDCLAFKFEQGTAPNIPNHSKIGRGVTTSKQIFKL